MTTASEPTKIVPSAAPAATSGPRGWVGFLCHMEVWIGIAMAWAIVLVALKRPEWHLTHPKYLVPAALWLVWPHGSGRTARVQAVVFLYMALLVLLTAMPLQWDLKGLTRGHLPIAVSQTTGVLAVIALGRLMGLRRGGCRPASLAGDLPVYMAVAVLMVHQLVLVPLLRWKYDFGCEGIPAAAGHVGLCLIGLVLLMPAAGSHRLRAAVGLMMAALLLLRG